MKKIFLFIAAALLVAVNSISQNQTASLLPANCSLTIGSSTLPWGEQWICANNFIKFRSYNTANFFLGVPVGTTYNDGNFLFNTGCPTLTSGFKNVLVGSNAGESMTTGNQNICIGMSSGQKNTSGNLNVYVGVGAGQSGMGAAGNTAIGSASLSANIGGLHNVAVGFYALQNAGSLASGSIAVKGNVGLGYQAGTNIRTASGNTCVGLEAGKNIENPGIADPSGLTFEKGGNNTIVGTFAGGNIISGNYNTIIGASANTSGATMNKITKSTALGYNASVGMDNAMAFGGINVNRWGFGIVVNSTTIPSTKCLVVGNSATNGNGAHLTANGFWTNTSSRTYKDRFEKLDATEVLIKVNQMEITRWRYTDSEEYHIGPVAEDFYEAFHLGLDNKSIGTADPGGVALVAIQAISKEIETINQEKEKLMETVANMEKALAMCCQNYTPTPNKPVLLQNQPNPFSQKSIIGYTLPENFGKAEIKVFNMSGELVQTISVLKGTTITEIEAGTFAPGIYVYVMEIDGISIDSKQMVVTK